MRSPLRDVREVADLTGLPLRDIVAFRPERLALHEVLVRVTADISVPDGTRIEDLGINFRQITRTILERGHRAAHGVDRGTPTGRRDRPWQR